MGIKWSKLYLFLDVLSVLCQQAGDDGILAEGAIVHQLSGGERCHGVEEAHGCLFEVAYGHCVETLIGFEPVPAVPVPSLLNQARGIQTMELVVN